MNLNLDIVITIRLKARYLISSLSLNFCLKCFLSSKESPPTPIFFQLLLGFWITCVQSLLLVFCSGVTPGRAWEPSRMPGIEPCQPHARKVPVLSLQPSGLQKSRKKINIHVHLILEIDFFFRKDYSHKKLLTITTKMVFQVIVIIQLGTWLDCLHISNTDPILLCCLQWTELQQKVDFSKRVVTLWITVILTLRCKNP